MKVTNKSDMDLTVDEYLEGLLSPEAASKPSDIVPPEQVVVELPPWFDENLFNRGRKFFWSHSYSVASAMLLGLVAVFSVPSILRVLVGSRRSSSTFTAYKRYLSTLLHIISWYEHELKPGSVSWRSLTAVRTRHVKATLSGKIQGSGLVSQRDVALTLYGFIGFIVLKPTRLGVFALHPDDWEGFNHFWRTIGYMIGLEDRYNLCRKNIEETRLVVQAVQDRVFTPCLTNVPEYFEHMTRVMLDGLWSINPTLNDAAIIYQTKYLADVPGYVLNEEEKIAFQKRLKAALKDRPLSTGVDPMELISKPAVEGLPSVVLPKLYYHDYDIFHNIPVYKNLSPFQKYKLNSFNFFFSLYLTFLGRLYFNINYVYSLYLMKYFPYLAFPRFGVITSYVNMFLDSPKDDTDPLPNSEYYKKEPVTWYSKWLSWVR